MENNWTFFPPTCCCCKVVQRDDLWRMFLIPNPHTNRRSGDLNWHLILQRGQEGILVMMITNAAEQTREKKKLSMDALLQKEKKKGRTDGKNVEVKCRHIKSHAEMVLLPHINGHINCMTSQVPWKVFVGYTHTHTRSSYIQSAHLVISISNVNLVSVERGC